MASPQSATAPIIIIVIGVILLFIAPPIGAIAIVFGAILLGVRVVAGTANTITSAAEQTKSCPFCAEKIKAEATVCRYCGRDLNPPH